MEPIDKIHPVCLRCHRKLKTEEAQRLGYGPVCWEKIQHEKQPKPLFQYNGGKK